MAAQIEKSYKIPCVSESFALPDLVGIVQLNALLGGVPAARIVQVPPDTFIQDYSPYVPQFIDGLTKPLTADEAKSGTYQAPVPPRIAMTGTYNEIQAYFEGDLVAHPTEGPVAWMTDGLAITPPTEEAVAQMLKGTSHKPDETITFKNAYGTRVATVEKIAVNAVMAGCKPEYMPAVLAIAETGACVGYSGDSSYGNLYVVSGPYAKEIGMNYGFDFYSANNPANKTIQRAAQLMGINLGGVVHGVNMLERTGNLLWGMTFAENPDTPWETLNVNNGYPSDNSIMLYFGGKVEVIPFQNFEIVNAKDLEEAQAGTPAHAVGALQANTNVNSGIIILTADTARLWQKKYPNIAGTMNMLEQYFMDNVKRSTDLKYDNYWWLKSSKPPADWKPGTAGFEKAITNPKNITIIVAGGSGDAWSFGFGSGPGPSASPGVISIDKWK